MTRYAFTEKIIYISNAWSTHLKMFARMPFDRSPYTCIAVLHEKQDYSKSKMDQLQLYQ